MVQEDCIWGHYLLHISNYSTKKMLEDAGQNNFQDIISWNSTGSSVNPQTAWIFRTDHAAIFHSPNKVQVVSAAKLRPLRFYEEFIRGLNKGNYSNNLFRRLTSTLYLFVISQPSRRTAISTNLPQLKPTMMGNRNLSMSALNMRHLWTLVANFVCMGQGILFVSWAEVAALQRMPLKAM
jgi:hypothetical protein